MLTASLRIPLGVSTNIGGSRARVFGRRHSLYETAYTSGRQHAGYTVFSAKLLPRITELVLVVVDYANYNKTDCDTYIRVCCVLHSRDSRDSWERFLKFPEFPGIKIPAREWTL